MDDSFLCARYTGFDPVRAALGEVLPLINQTIPARSMTNRKATTFLQWESPRFAVAPLFLNKKLVFEPF